jgi:hypothetical protein
MRRWNAGLALSLALGGCVGREAAAADPLVRDSAGVRLVENPPLDPEREAARLVGPIFRTGWEDGEPTFEVINGGKILSDGRIAIVDINRDAMYLLSATGQVERRIGRSGDGPGEFQGPTSLIETSADSLLVFDRGGGGRISRFTNAGDFAWSVRWLDARRVSHEPAVAVPDGRLLFLPRNPRNSRLEPGDGWLSASVFLADAHSGESDTIATVDYWLQRHLDGITRQMMTYGSTSATEDGWVYARNDQTEVRWYASDGTLTQIARWSEDRDLSPADGAAYVAFHMEQFRQGPEFSPAGQAQMRRIWEATVEAWNGRTPSFRELIADREGGVWASEFRLTSYFPARYRIFAPDGTIEGWIETPPNFYILDVRDDLVLGVEQDELDIVAVSLYRIEG